MKTPEDEAFDELARKQGAWGGGFKAKQAMAADKLQKPERAALELCDYLECNDASMEAQCEAAAFIRKALAQPAQEPVAHILQFIKELRPAIGPTAVMGKSKTTQEWFDIVINEIERLQTAKEKNND
jgi:hypothetical protein